MHAFPILHDIGKAGVVEAAAMSPTRQIGPALLLSAPVEHMPISLGKQSAEQVETDGVSRQ